MNLYYYFLVIAKPPDFKKLKQTLKSELIKIWSKLSDNLENEIDEFTKKLYENKIIGKGLRKTKNYEEMMDMFISSMDGFDTMQEFEGHCSTLLDILADIGGGAKIIGAALGKSWKIAVESKYGIRFLIHYGKYILIKNIISKDV